MGLVQSLTNVNGTLFFTAIDGINGFELWKSDGTDAGTIMVKDIRPGIGSANISQLANINGTLFFRADDGANGVELWTSDGTELGTVLVDINPYSLSSSPRGFTRMGNTLFFSATRWDVGAELFSLELPKLLQGKMKGTLFCDTGPGMGIKQQFEDTVTFTLDLSELPLVTANVKLDNFPDPFTLTGMALLKSPQKGVLQLFGNDGDSKELALSGKIKMNKIT
jgi:ELWxxDGT repeat protein